MMAENKAGHHRHVSRQQAVHAAGIGVEFVVPISLHKHQGARKPANCQASLARDLSPDGHDPTGHLTAPVNTLDEESQVIDDL